VAIEVKSVNAGPLGRRWVTYCDVCGVNLPGRHADREFAENLGSTHENERHLQRLMERLAAVDE
jgi:hypothetical protein